MTDYAGQAPPQRQYRDVPETEAGPDATKSIGEALGDVTRDLSVLFQQEVALAKAEVRQTATRAGQAAGMFAGAAIAAFLFVLFLSVALWEALSESVGRGWGAVIVAAIWLVAGLVLFAVARAQMKKVSGLPQTTETVRQVPNALKGQEERNR
jgi:Putative Actinobacterial Holin-X, holin superfamily III